MCVAENLQRRWFTGEELIKKYEGKQMIYKEIPVQVQGSLPETKLTLYIQDYSADMWVQERPMVVICPGGGYEHLSVREGESVALQFMAMGLHAAVLRYSVSPAAYPVQLMELAYAVKYIRSHAKEWHVREDKILVQGSSAGGHLAASLGVSWKEAWLMERVGAQKAEEIRPNGMILSYPVITAGKFAHRGSFDKLLGEDRGYRKEWLEKLSLENRVTEDTPPAFIWHTFSDATVPVENSLLFVNALCKHHIPAEFHMYPRGEHGLALATDLTAGADGKYRQAECASWITLAKEWIAQL